MRLVEFKKKTWFHKCVPWNDLNSSVQ